MCGVIGVHSKKANVSLIKKIFLQSMIRGKHATGVSWVKNGTVHTIKEGIPANQFIEKYNFNDFVNEDGGIYLVGHIRYSTSDIRFNQPFSDGKISIVHNGVLSQEPVEQWKYKTETSNDSEMILRSYQESKHPLQDFPESSMAVCVLREDKTLIGFRNEARPLWVSQDEDGVYFTSTKDIAIRSGLLENQKCLMYTSYTVDDWGSLHIEGFTHDAVFDLQ